MVIKSVAGEERQVLQHRGHHRQQGCRRQEQSRTHVQQGISVRQVNRFILPIVFLKHKDII